MAQKKSNRNLVPVSKTGKYVIDGGKFLNQKQWNEYVKKNNMQFERVVGDKD